VEALIRRAGGVANVGLFEREPSITLTGGSVMFAVEFRLGEEHHDVYTYFGWMTLTIDDPIEVVTFMDAEKAANEFILEYLELKDLDWCGTWQIRTVRRVAYGADGGSGMDDPWPSEYVL
jgi:hypothetical protein